MSFKDIRGQDRAVEILKEDMKQSRFTGSYLFAGEEGIGKKLIAKTLAKAINCLAQMPGTDSCDGCSSCLRIESNQHPDAHIIEAEATDSIKIERIRQLQKDINLKPYEGRKKVFIINDAHNLTPEAENALLKVLEEPPPDSLIILVSAKPAMLFKTVISRCKIIKFYPLERTALKEILMRDYLFNDRLAHFLAYFCEGRLGYALRLKDTDILREKNSIIDEFALPNLSGHKGYTKTFTAGGISNKLKSENLSPQDRGRLRSYLNILATWFRDIYLIKVGTPYRELINLDRKEELIRLMHCYAWSDLDEILNSISNSLLYLEQNVNVKLLLSNLKLSLKEVFA